MTRKKISPPTEQGELIRFLREELSKRQTRHPSYSVRAFARDLGIQAPIISELLRGKRRLTLKLAEKICEGLKLDPKQKSKFLKKVSIETHSILQNENRFEYSQLEKDSFDLIADWYFFAILSLAETTDFVSDPEDIAKRLGLPKPKVNSALETLIRMGLLKEEAGHYRITGQQFTTTNDIPSVAIQKNHAQGLELAHDALLQIPVELREFNASTVTLDPQMLPEIKKLLRELKRKVADTMQSTDKHEVYRFQIQLFPLSKKQR